MVAHCYFERGLAQLSRLFWIEICTLERGWTEIGLQLHFEVISLAKLRKATVSKEAVGAWSLVRLWPL